VGAAAGIVLLLVAIALFVAGRSAAAPARPGAAGDDEASAAKIQQELEATAAVIEDLKQKLELTGEVPVSRVNELEDEMATSMQQAEDLVRQRRELEELQATRDRGAASRDAAAAEAEAAAEQRTAEEETWQRTVESLHLPAGTSPRTAGEVFAKAETARGLVRQMAEYDSRLGAMGEAKE